jgi:hypothetical protein
MRLGFEVVECDDRHNCCSCNDHRRGAGNDCGCGTGNDRRTGNDRGGCADHGCGERVDGGGERHPGGRQ